YNQPNISSTYIGGGLDRYGRIINHSWLQNNNPLVHIIHSYDYASNRTKRHDAVHAANSELYNYDNLGQIKSLNRGTLNTNQTAITTVNHSESWNFDKTGNWSQYTKNGTVENRTHNAANELQGIAAHDANGNMILMPGLKGKYDAWNRLVEVRDTSDNLVAQYEYNGLNQRIKKTVNGVVTKSFFNENWQELESQTGNEITSYVWGIRYIDDLVLREKGSEILYSLADPNWNVIAICDPTGNIQERYTYDAFGKQNICDANFNAKTTTDFNWNRTFTGQVLDSETGLMLYRNRFYHVGLGRFVNRDPIGYEGGDENLYRYVFNSAINLFDEYGLIPIALPVVCAACATCLGPAAVLCRGQNTWSNYVQCLQIAYDAAPFIHKFACEGACGSCLLGGAGKAWKCLPKKRPPSSKPPTTSDPLPHTQPKPPQSPKQPKSRKPHPECTPAQKVKYHTAIHVACKTRPFSCKDQRLTSLECFTRSAIANTCAEARRTYQKKCWRPSDPGWAEHQEKISEAAKASRLCYEKGISLEAEGR
ncbi:MAG: RHS repeat-associated core domain-containing protein, partial [Planctomycetaceae bacterium]|nr:RHS repeat-associated core domain-containing protein [Planctomycetaceae bacterium]